MRYLVTILVCLKCLCVSAAPGAVDIHWDGGFERELSAYNLFADAVAQTPSAGLVAYDVITPLFSDYAEKHRFVYLPEGTAATYHAEEPFDFPVGAALVKTFSYPYDFRDLSKGRRLIETRLMIHTPEGWTGAAYLWNEEQTEATLKVAGKRVPVEWTHYDGRRRSITYLVPNMNQCEMCHRGDAPMRPIGIKARHLNRDFAYADGARNQLDYWSARGLLSGAPDANVAPRHAKFDDPDTGDTEERTRAYLDMNCAHCHNDVGHASSTRLDFTVGETDPNRRGVWYRPTAAGNASRGRDFAVVPGNPQASFLLHRLISNEANVRMPEIGRTIPHDEGVALIRDWINGIEE